MEKRELNKRVRGRASVRGKRMGVKGKIRRAGLDDHEETREKKEGWDGKNDVSSHPSTTITVSLHVYRCNTNT